MHPEPVPNPVSHWFHSVKELLDALYRDEKESIAQATRLLKKQVEKDRLIHVFGVSGHSVIGCEEFFWRAGGLARIAPLFDLSLNLSGGGLKSTELERVPGVGDKVIKSANLTSDDLLIITSIYGMNAATIDAALEAKKRGVKIIAITSRKHAENTPKDFVARHPSQKNLADLADVTIDNHVPHGDCIVHLDGLPQALGPCSTILVSACVQWLVMETASQCLAEERVPEVWQSANTVGGDARNHAYREKFIPLIKAL